MASGSADDLRTTSRFDGMMKPLWLGAGRFFQAVAEHHIECGVARGNLPGRMQGFEKCHQRCCFRWAQAVSIRRHVAASLNHLANQLVLGEPDSHAVQGRTSLPTRFSQRMAVAALFELKNESTLPLKGRRAVQKSVRHGITTPRIHVRTPRRESGKVRKFPQRNGSQHYG